MRALSRYEPINERRHVVFDTNILESKREYIEQASYTKGKYFDHSEIKKRGRELQECNELRAYFVSASCNEHCVPHPSLKEISTKGKQKGNSFKEFLMMIFS